MPGAGRARPRRGDRYPVPVPSHATAPTQARPALSTGPTRVVAVVAGTVLGLVALWAVALVLALPPTVDGLTIENPTGTALHVAVAAPGDGRTLGLGVVDAGAELSLTAVLDQGSSWQVLARPRGGDGPATTVTLSRAELAEAGWRVVLPASTAGGDASRT